MPPNPPDDGDIPPTSGVTAIGIALTVAVLCLIAALAWLG